MVHKLYLCTIKSVKLNKIGVPADLVDDFWFGEYKKYPYLCSKYLEAFYWQQFKDDPTSDNLQHHWPL